MAERNVGRGKAVETSYSCEEENDRVELIAKGIPTSEIQAAADHTNTTHGVMDTGFSSSSSFPGETSNSNTMDMTSDNIPQLDIAILIVGTRGDVQPFIAIGKRLKEHYGHRVRLASHAVHKELVEQHGLRFYPLGGDPKLLAGYMVKNRGFIPSKPVGSGMSKQKKEIKKIIPSLLKACIAPDVDSSLPFRAQAIIANPPAYGHTSVAEYLDIPIHIFFTMPWTPTSEFPHPLSRCWDPSGYKESYTFVDEMIWQGIRGMINDFRKKKLKLRRLPFFGGLNHWASYVPYGYIWSRELIPKPKDWGPRIDVVGFCYLDGPSDFERKKELLEWLSEDDERPPIYIGFGSLPVQKPAEMTKIIVEALEETGQRGIISEGWGGLGVLKEPKDFVYTAGECSHDWLFPRCKAVVHHGGAGTTAAGLKARCPTTIVPFFGDQIFWGERVHARGVGPAPIPVVEFSREKLIDAIYFMLKQEVIDRANELAKSIGKDDGAIGAAEAFHKHLRCERPQPDRSPPSSGIFKPFFRSAKKFFGS